MQEGKEKMTALLNFLDCKILDPILEAVPELYSSERDRRILLKVKKEIAQEKESFHNSQLTPTQIYIKYFHQIYKELHCSLGKELEDLELPRFMEIKEQFIELCKEMNVR